MAIYANITADQGSNFNTTVDVTDTNGQSVDLTSYTIRGQIRKTYSSSTAIDFATTKNSTGQIGLSLTASQTGAMKSGRYVYDVEIVSSAGVVTRVIEGQFEITPRVTKP